MAKMTKLVVSISAKSNSYIKSMQKAQRANKNLGRSYGRLQKKTKNFSRAMKGALVFLSGGALAKSILKTGLEFEKMDRIMKFATGTSAKASEALGRLSAVSDKMGLHFLTAAGSFAKFNAVARYTSIAGKEAEDAFIGIATAGAALGLSVDDQRGIFKALEQMLSKGNVQAEELRGQLGERLPGAISFAAKAMGVTTRELNKMLEQGQVLAEDMIPKLSRVLREELGASAVIAAQQTQASITRLSNAWDKFKDSMFNSSFVIGATDFGTKALNRLAGGFDTAVPSLKKLTDNYKELINVGKKAQNLPVPKIKTVIEKQIDQLNGELSYALKKLERANKLRSRRRRKPENHTDETRDLKGRIYLLTQIGEKMRENDARIAKERDRQKADANDAAVGTHFEKFTQKFTEVSVAETKLKELEDWFVQFKIKLDRTKIMSDQYVEDLSNGERLYLDAKDKLLKDIESKKQEKEGKVFKESSFQASIQNFTGNFKSAMKEIKSEMVITNGAVQDSMKDMVGNMSDGLVEFVVNGKASFADFTRSILIDIAKVATKRLFASFAASLFADGGVIEGGVSKFAKGGVFGGKVTAFAGGGVVDKPTFFPMKGNQTGVMGEAGAEAIMPLKKDKSGKLGVTAQISGAQGKSSTVINQTFNIDATNSAISANDLEEAVRRGAELGYQKVADDFNRGGTISQLQGA